MSDASVSSSKPDDPNIEKESDDESESRTIDGPNPYENFNPIFIGDRFLKSSTILQFTKLLNESVINQLSAITDRKDFIKYVEAIFRHLRLNPQKFIFFLARPEPSEKEEKNMIIIRSDRKIICIRKNSTYVLKGHVAHIFFKSKNEIQITMSKGLFMKLYIWKDLKNLKKVIPDFLNLNENPQPHNVEELFFKSLMDLPNKISDLDHNFKNSFLSLFLTANLEFCRKLALTDFKEENIFKVSQDIMFIFIKSHLWDHLMRTLIPLYVEKQVEIIETVMADYKIYFVPCLLHICRMHFGQNFLPKVSKVLYPIVCQKNFDEYTVLTFVQLVLNMNFPTQILLIAKELYKAIKIKFSEDEYAAASVVGSYLITDFIFPEIQKEIVEKEEKRRFLTFLNVLTFNKEFKEGTHFFGIIKKLYISLAEAEITTTKTLNTEKTIFSYHISHLFNYFQENATLLYDQFSKINLSHEKTPVYCEVMELFDYVDKIKSGKGTEPENNYEEELILELNKVHEKIKKGKIKIKRTNKKDLKHIVKKQKQDKKKLITELKEKKVEKKKQEKIEKRNAKKLERKNTKKAEKSNIVDNEELSEDDKSEINDSKNDEVIDIEHKSEKDDEEIKDEEIKDEEIKDEEIKDEEIKDEEIKDEEIKDEEIKDEEIIDEEIKDEEIKDEEIKDEDEFKVDDDDEFKFDDDGVKGDEDFKIDADEEFKFDEDGVKGDEEFKVDDEEFKFDEDGVKGDEEFKVDDEEFKFDEDGVKGDEEFKFDDEPKVEDEMKLDDDTKDATKVDHDEIDAALDSIVHDDEIDHKPDADSTLGVATEADTEIKPDTVLGDEATKEVGDEDKTIEKPKESKKNQKKKFGFFKKKG